VLLKAENLQRVGAFKFRGAYNKVAQVDKATFPGGVVACSSGNHAQGVAAAAALMGFKSVIVMPADAPRLKIARTRAFGAEVVAYDRAREDRDAIARDLCTTRQAALVHPFDDPDVIAGQGTAGLEMMEQAEAMGATPDIVLVGASGGGLIGGVSIAVKEKSPAAAIYSVEPAGFDDLARSLKGGAREKNARLSGSICDALLAATPGELTFEVAKRNLAGGLSVTDDEAKAAVRYAFEELKLVLEPGGAVSLAAILAGKLPFRERPSRPCCRAATSTPRCSPRSSRSSAKLLDLRMNAHDAEASGSDLLPASPPCLPPSSSSPAPASPTCRCGSIGRASVRARSPSSRRHRCSCAWRQPPSLPLLPTAPAITAAS
jgi:threonine dehydratase